jgi:hypothetical protein
MPISMDAMSHKKSTTTIGGCLRERSSSVACHYLYLYQSMSHNTSGLSIAQGLESSSGDPASFKVKASSSKHDVAGHPELSLMAPALLQQPGKAPDDSALDEAMKHALGMNRFLSEKVVTMEYKHAMELRSIQAEHNKDMLETLATSARQLLAADARTAAQRALAAANMASSAVVAAKAVVGAHSAGPHKAPAEVGSAAGPDCEHARICHR